MNVNYFVKINLKDNTIKYSSLAEQENDNFCNVFFINNCNTIIYQDDYKDMDGIITSYDLESLDKEKEK